MSVITMNEAMGLIREHGYKDCSEGVCRTDHWVILNNGWKLSWDVEVTGPYSEYTPDVDIDLIINLDKKEFYDK